MYCRNSVKFLLKKPIAHRGLHDEKSSIYENSLPAFREAIEKGLPIEIDLHILKDGQIVVFHDSNLKRMTGKSAEIKDLGLTELPTIKKSEDRIPTLQEVLSLVRGRVPLLIEFKNDHVGTALEEAALPILKKYRGKFAIQSFDPRTLHFFKKHAPKIPRGQLVMPKTRQESDNLRSYLASKYPDNFYTRPDFIAYDIRSLPNPAIEKLRNEKQIPIIGWTAREENHKTKATDYCDNLICEKII